MPRPQKGKIEKLEGYTDGLLVLAPLLALLGTGLLHWTMQVSLEPNLLMRFVKLVGLLFYILFVVLAPPLLLAWGVSFLRRRSDVIFGVVLFVVLIPWGFWYLIPLILENWDAFSRFVEDFGAV
jgi:hypothetical protein